MKKFWSKVRGEKVKVGGQGQRWWFAFLIAAATLVAPLASNASEFPGMNAAYAQRLKRDRAISSLWLAPQALISTVPRPSAVSLRSAVPALGRGVGQPLSETQETPVPPLIAQHSSFNTSLTPIPNWSARGAYEDWAHIDLPDTFRFPVGLEYVPRITLMAWGEVRGIAELPRRVSLEPNNSSVSHGLTPSNTYLIAWQNACVERSATNRVNAAIELFPDGSVVTTWQPHDPNEHPTTINQQPTLPPGFHGHGQDNAWCLANFQESYTAITNKGYNAWLMEDKVGINVANGTFKASVTISSLPEFGPCYLICGPYKVIVSEPGTYSFPLQVLTDYDVYTAPEALPLEFDYDDGFRPDDGAPYSPWMMQSSGASRAQRLSRSASDIPNPYKINRFPEVYIHPNVLTIEEIRWRHIQYFCNAAGIASRDYNCVWGHAVLIFLDHSTAAIHEAQSQTEVDILMRRGELIFSGRLSILPLAGYLDPPQTNDFPIVGATNITDTASSTNSNSSVTSP